MRFATFNLENLFARPKVFKLATWAEGEPILKAYAEFNALIERVNYTQAKRLAVRRVGAGPRVRRSGSDELHALAADGDRRPPELRPRRRQGVVPPLGATPDPDRRLRDDLCRRHRIAGSERRRERGRRHRNRRLVRHDGKARALVAGPGADPPVTREHAVRPPRRGTPLLPRHRAPRTGCHRGRERPRREARR